MFSYYRMCSLTIECVPIFFRTERPVIPKCAYKARYLLQTIHYRLFTTDYLLQTNTTERSVIPKCAYKERFPVPVTLPCTCRTPFFWNGASFYSKLCIQSTSLFSLFFFPSFLFVLLWNGASFHSKVCIQSSLPCACHAPLLFLVPLTLPCTCKNTLFFPPPSLERCVLTITTDYFLQTIYYRLFPTDYLLSPPSLPPPPPPLSLLRCGRRGT